MDPTIGSEGEIQQPPEKPGVCSMCQGQITDEYFMLNGEPWCPACHAKESTVKPRLRFSTFMRAVLFGLIAGLLGGGLWAGTTIITGYELGLVAVFVGLIVGYGIKAGGRNIGGRALQFLALVMTFYTLAYANIPIIIHFMAKDPEIRKQVSDFFHEEGEKIEKARGAAAMEDEVGTKTLAVAADELNTRTLALAEEDESTSSVAVASAAASAVDAENMAPSQKMGAGKVILILLLLLVALLTIGPPAIYVLLIVSSPMTAVFLAIALWEAWRINRREERVFAGPFNSREMIEFDKVDSVAP